MGSDQRDRRPWPYSVGTRGVNAVRVYSRDDCGENCHIEWFDDRGRIQRALSTIVGAPVTDKTLARDIAERVASAQLQKREQHARALVFGSSGITLGSLLEQLHEHREAEWSASFVKDQRRYRDFWLAQLGRDTLVHQAHIYEARVKQIVDRAAPLAKRPWKDTTKRAYMRYIKDAITFGKDQLKLLDDRVMLSALKMPDADSVGVAYTSDEVARLLPKLYDVDLRAYLVAVAYIQGGRRMNATRLLTAKDVRFATFPTPQGKRAAAIVSYPKETDKARQEGQAVLTDIGPLLGVTALRALLATPAVRATGLLLPVGDLDDAAVRVGRKKREAIRKETLEDLLQDAEKAAEIPHVRYRGYHGLKRRFATMSKRERELASAQSGTSEATLGGIYEQDDDLAGKFELATMLGTMLGGEKPRTRGLGVVRGGKR